MRQAKMVALFGKPGSGKTTELLRLMKLGVKKGERFLCIDPDGQEALYDDSIFTHYNTIEDLPDLWKGCAVVIYKSSKEKSKLIAGEPTFPYMLKKCVTNNGEPTSRKQHGDWYNFTLILDDANTYMRGQIESELATILGRKRQFGMDIITTSHGWGNCPAEFMRYIDVYRLGPTDDSPASRAQVLTGPITKKHLAWQTGVNEWKKQNPGKYIWASFTRNGDKFSGQE
tara:strand:- start:53 stop:736 length:684 start_codon:yes stop_codon:yes gene_type:complete